MNQQIVNEVDRLREDLEAANRDAEQTKACLMSKLSRATGDAQLYRAICGCLVITGVIMAMIELLQR